ncbi:peptide ABC transporter substrate-binding protein [Salinicoccus sp. CNSTN-B1]
MKKSRFFMMVLLVMMAALLTACYGGSGEESAKDSGGDGGESEGTADGSSGGTLHMATPGELPTVQTNGNLDGLSQTIMLNIYEGLFRLDQDNELTEGMAEDYEMTENEDGGVTYTFNIREDAVWSNGDPVTAHDFTYAWKRALNPETFSPHAYLMAPIVNANEIQDPDDELYGKVDELGVEATDDKTLVVELNNNVPYFLEVLTNPVMFPQNEDFIAEQGDDYGLEPENVISNGPFYLDDWNHDQGWVLSKNEEYWDSDAVELDAVDYKVAKDASTEVNLYETGDIDVVNLTSEFVDMYADSEEYTTNINTEVYFVRFNFQK